MDRAWHQSYDPQVPHSLHYPDKCLPLLIEQGARALPSNIATEFLGARLTYEALWVQILSMANALHQLGVKHDTKVAVMLPNCPQAVIAFYATLWLGGVAVMTNPLYVEREMEYQWNDAGVEFLIVLDHLYPKVEKVLLQTRIRAVIVTSLQEYLPWYLKPLYPLKARKQKLFTAVPYDEGTLNFSRLIRRTPPTPPPCEVQPDDLALLQYTGGTTGIPKGVMLSHRNILANVVQISSWFPELQCGQERFIALLPFFHVFGMTVALNFPLYTGCTSILLPRFDIDGLLKTLHKSRPTLFPGVPTLFTALVQHPKVQSYDLSSIRFCITGSAPMPVEILKKFEALTQSIIIEGYGLTESSPVTHCNPLKGTRKIGSIGIPLPDTDCRIVDLEEGNQEVAPGESGELLIRGPQVMQSYWNMPDETTIALRDGWLYTGDIARMDEEGYFFLVDRKKDLILTSGYNVYPREIDEVLYEHPAVREAAAIGIPDAYRGEVVKAFVVLDPGRTVTAEEIIAFCKERLAAYKVPRAVEFRESLPKTIVGKISRKELSRESKPGDGALEGADGKP